MRATRDLRWPADPDLYRDIAQAQTIADGSLLDDPYYRGETIWHNPLAPLVVAGLSRVLGVPVPTMYVRAGAYLNLLGLIAFYLWVARMAGTWGAAVGTIGFVFYRDTWAPAWVAAAYSPWLFAMTSSQAPFYFGLLAYRGALVHSRGMNPRSLFVRGGCRPPGGGGPWRYAASGLLLGLTFLAAAPPAFILAGVVIVAAVVRGAGWLPSPAPYERLGPRVRAVLVDHVVLVLVAVVVSSPLLYSIVWRYRLQVRNPVPTSWEWAGLHSFADFAQAHFGWPALVAVIGGAILIRRARTARVDVAIVVAFAMVAAGLLGYRTVFAWGGIVLPQFVPSHYFVFYLKALQWALVGIAIAAGVSRLKVSPAVARFVPTAVTALTIAAALPQYRTRGYLDSARATALAEESRQNLREAYEWIRANTSPRDVFLASPEVALQVVGPAGRKVVAAGEVYSSPYVDWAARSRASRGMWRALREADHATFRSLARASDVTYVISSRREDPGIDDLLAEQQVPGLEPVFKSGGLRIHRLSHRSSQSFSTRYVRALINPNTQKDAP